MSIKAVCHWGEAEDVCIIVGGKDEESMSILDSETQIPMTRDQARKLAAELLARADACDELERNIPTPNAQTRAAMEELSAGKGVRSDSVESLMDDLNEE